MKMMRINYFGFLLTVLLFLSASCKEEEIVPPTASTIAAFEVSLDNEGTAPCQATFQNSSINAVGYLWDFGDGQTSTDQNPIHLYDNPGIYEVSLTATPHEALYYNKLVKKKTLIIKDPLAGAKRTLYFTDRTTHNVRYFALDGNTPVLQEFGHSALAKPYGMIIDTINDKIYVSDYQTSTIFRYNMDGFGLVTIASTTTNAFISGPIGMFIWDNKLYWAQEGGIYRCDLDGSNPVPWILTPTTTAPEMPIHMAFDPASETIYFTNDKYEFTGGVYKVKLDGSGMTLLVPNTNGGAIDIDIAGGKIYYADYDKGLCMANLDGSGEVVINNTINGVFVWGMAINKAEGKIYWSDKTAKVISRANLDGSSPEVVISNVNPHAMTIDKFR